MFTKFLWALFIRRLWVFVIVLNLSACSGTPSLSYLPENAVVLAFGDSLTAGMGASAANSYPSVLSQLAERNVVNAGVSGEETAQGVKRLAGVLRQVNPDLLLLLEGGNDILRNRDLRRTKQNLAAMIELAHSMEIEVVLIGVPEKRLFSSVAPLYEELADQYKIVLIDNLLASLLRKSQYKSDAVHLNKQGYRVMAESIYAVLVDRGAL